MRAMLTTAGRSGKSLRSWARMEVPRVKASSEVKRGSSRNFSIFSISASWMEEENKLRCMQWRTRKVGLHLWGVLGEDSLWVVFVLQIGKGCDEYREELHDANEGRGGSGYVGGPTKRAYR